MLHKAVINLVQPQWRLQWCCCQRPALEILHVDVGYDSWQGRTLGFLCTTVPIHSEYKLKYKYTSVLPIVTVIIFYSLCIHNVALSDNSVIMQINWYSVHWPCQLNIWLCNNGLLAYTLLDYARIFYYNCQTHLSVWMLHFAWEIKIHEQCPPKSIIKPCGALQGTGSIRSMSMHTMTRWQGYISVEKVQLHGRDTHAYNNIIHIVFW